MALVTVEDVQSYLGEMRLTDKQKESLADIVNGVRSELEMYINRLLEPQVIRESLRSDARGYLNPSFAPVTEIMKIGMFGTGYTMRPTYQLWNVGETEPNYGEMPKTVAVPTNGGTDMIEGNAVYVGIPDAWFMIEYISGGDSFITPYAGAAKQAICRVAAREFMILHDSTMALNKTAADIDENIRRTPRGWSDYELARFDRIRRRILL